MQAQPKKTIQMQAPSSSGGFSFARKQDSAAAPKTIGAKKLDLDFGATDDFFNSFQPAAQPEAGSNQLTSISSSANETKVNDPFEMASTSTAKPAGGGLGFGFGESGTSHLTYVTKAEE